MADTVLVGFSGGKDSVATLDLCVRHFARVVPFFMYLVPGLSFQEAQIRWYERRYGLEVLRVPHPMLSTWLRFGVYRKPHYDWPEISFNDVYHYVRLQAGCWWMPEGSGSPIPLSGGRCSKKAGRLIRSGGDSIRWPISTRRRWSGMWLPGG